jgi:hypothetical protein
MAVIKSERTPAISAADRVRSSAPMVTRKETTAVLANVVYGEHVGNAAFREAALDGADQFAGSGDDAKVEGAGGEAAEGLVTFRFRPGGEEGIEIEIEHGGAALF